MKKNLEFKTVILLVLVAFSLFSCKDNKGPDYLGLYQQEVKFEAVDHLRLNYMAADVPSFTRSNFAPALEAAPSIPSNAIDMVASGYADWKAQKNTNYFVPAGASFTDAIKLLDNTYYYVAGHLKLNTYGKGGVIYILPGGSIEITTTLSDVNIECWGGIEVGTSFALNPNSSFKNYVSIIDIKNAEIQGEFTSFGDVVANSFIATGSKHDVYIEGNLDVENTIIFSTGVEVTVAKNVTANKLEINSNAIANFECVVDIEKQVDFNSSALVNVKGSLSAFELTLSSNANINLYANSVVSVEDKLSIENPNTKFYNSAKSSYAVIACGKMIIHQDVIDRLGGGPIDLHAKTITNNTGKDLRWSSNVIFNGTTYIQDSECNHGFGELTPIPNPEYALEHIAEILSPTPERISATSLDFKEMDLYVSWHERNEPYQGYIDILNLTDIKIKATLHSTSLDFNHIVAADDKMYVVGGGKKGAFYSEVNHSTQDKSVVIDVQRITGSSGNCLLQDGEKKWVISGANGGVTVIPTLNFIPLNEAKYITKYGASLAVLAGIDNSTIYEYSTTGNLEKSYSVGSIPVSNGKNTIIADNDVLYVCLGGNGLKSFKNGVQINEWIPEQGSVNCVDVDDKFIYVANGVGGLSIIDKTTFKEIKSYVLGGASANFVKKGNDGLIYVAYGLNGVHSFRLYTL